MLSPLTFPPAGNMDRMKTAYRPEIDGLRAIAVLGVLLFHLKIGAFKGGFAGVDVFFVISGYLITGRILSDAGAGRFSFQAFYIRRAPHLPALIFTVAVTFVAGCCGFRRLLKGLAKEIDHALLSIANIQYWRETRSILQGPPISFPAALLVVVARRAVLFVAAVRRRRGPPAEAGRRDRDRRAPVIGAGNFLERARSAGRVLPDAVPDLRIRDRRRRLDDGSARPAGTSGFRSAVAGRIDRRRHQLLRARRALVHAGDDADGERRSRRRHPRRRPSVTSGF